MSYIPYWDDGAVESGLFMFWGIVGVAAVFHGRSRSAPMPRLVSRAGFAVAGAVLSFVIYSGYVLERQSVESSHTVKSVDNLRQLSLALLMYEDDWKGTLPPANRWMDAIDNPKYLPDADKSKIFHNPYASGPYGYAFNKSLGAVSLDAIADPQDTVLLFETDLPQRNAAGSVGDLAQRQFGNRNCAFADGSAHWVNLSVTSRWRWMP